MADINQRRLFRKNPYWESNPQPQGYAHGGSVSNRGTPENYNNPYVSAANQRHIDQDYDNNSDASALPIPNANANFGMRPNSMPPLTAGQDSQGNPLQPDRGDAQVSYDDNDLVNQGLGSILNSAGKGYAALSNPDNYGPKTSPEDWLKRMEDADDDIGMRAVQKLIADGETEIHIQDVNRERQAILKDKLSTDPDFSDIGTDDSIEGANEVTGIEAALVDDETGKTVDEGTTAFLEANKRPDETLEEFAKRIGIKLSDKAYDNWDYIRDMSAGLLASKDTDFLGALGDASLHSNANRDKAEGSEDAKRTSVAMAKWRSDEAWELQSSKLAASMQEEILKLKDKEKEFKYAGQGSSHTDRNGNKVTDFIVKSGRPPPENTYIGKDGSVFYRITETDTEAYDEKLYGRKKELVDATDRMVSSDSMDNQIQYIASVTSYNNEMLSRGKSSGDMQDLFQEMRDNNIEGAGHLTKLIADGDDSESAEAAAQLASALEASGRIGKNLYRQWQEGMYEQLTNGENEELKYHIGQKAAELANTAHDANPDRVYRPVEFVRAATNYVMQNTKWEEEGINKFRFDTDQTALDAARKEVGDAGGFDAGAGTTGTFWSSWDLETQGYSEDHPLSELNWETPLNKPGENSWVNMNQYELLPPDRMQAYQGDAASVVTKLSRMQPSEGGVSQRELAQDVKDSAIDARLVWGGEDTLGTSNQQSNYNKPEKWYVEPELLKPDGTVVTRRELRDLGYMWQGTKNGGEWYSFTGIENDNPRRVQLNTTLKEKGYTFNKPKSFKY